MDNIEEKLKFLFKEWRVKPLLFCGAGLSRRYRSLPNWEDLLTEISNHIHPKNKYFIDKEKRKISKEVSNKNDILPLVGLKLKNEYNDMFFDGKIDEELQSIYDKKHNGDPFTIYLSQKLKKYDYNDTYEYEKKDFYSIKDKVSNIVTTNYDNLLEENFKFDVLIGEEEMILSRFNQLGVLYKIHGCVTKPESIVLTMEDYEALRKRKKYLIAKLLTLFTEYPVIFVGYSISDPDIVDILTDIKECLPESSLQEFGEKYIFINYVENPKDEKIFKAQIAGLPMYQVDLFDYTKLYKAMNVINTKYSVQTLKQLSDMITGLIYSESETEEKVRVQKLDNANDDEIAVLIGNKNSIFKLGYSVIDALTIFEDTFRNNGQFDNALILETTLPNIKHKISNTKFLPLWKLTKNYDKVLNSDLKKKRLDQLSYLFDGIHSSKSDKEKYLKIKKFNSLENIKNEYNNPNKIVECAYFSSEHLSINDIQEVLNEYWDEPTASKSLLKKLVVVYDFLVYKD